jgi:RNA polymerase sigma-70 factor (ECF subfamily)
MIRSAAASRRPGPPVFGGVRAFAPDGRPRGEPETELIHAAAAGDERAFEELRARFRPGVERICRLIVGRGVLEDCVQEVFLRIWRKAHLFDPRRGSAGAWVFAVARNVARSQRRVPTTIELAADTAVAPPPESVDEVWVRSAVARLPREERLVIELAYFHGLTQQEIAVRLGAPLGTVKSWNRRALSRLADLLEEYEP